MTGFGRGVAEHGKARATVDVRAVNHRFLDLKLRGALAPALEDAIGTRVRAAIVTTDRWLCAPYSEISFDDGHSDVTGTATVIVCV